jgi:hypothetical protein
MGRLAALLLLTLVIAGCRGAATPTVAPSPSTAATASPSGSFLTVGEAAAAYLAVADPYNTAVDAAQRQYGTRQTLEDHQRYWGLIAKADAAFIDGLKGIAFPPDVLQEASVLIKADEAFQQRARLVARSRSLAEVSSTSATANDAAAVVADKAARLRAALGIDPYAG